MSAHSLPDAADIARQKRRSRVWRSARRYLRHPGFSVGLSILVVLSIIAVAAPLIAPYGPTDADLMKTLQHPSAEHWIGTDQFGRDILSRLIWGTRISLEVAFAVVALSLTLGSLIGAIAGYAGGWVERIMMVVNDILLAFPGFLLALALVAARGSSLENVILAVSIAYTPRVAAVMRSVVITIRPRPFIEASRAIGMSSTRVLLRHVLPNALPPVIVVTTVSAATAILAEAGLSFLGLGVQPPTATWGNIISDGQGYITSNPLISLSAGLCIAVTVIALNLLGDGLRDTLDPQMRRYTSERML
ncbi:MAG: peptide/nickel transport system permease protein [Gammaproteobacteria bacterium]|jgi:peptide/nickel transport system permease protein